MINAKQADHLSPSQRTKIRNSVRSSLQLARHYGTSEAVIRLIQHTRVADHPARVAKRQRFWARVREGF